jgi:hypothetical protein
MLLKILNKTRIGFLTLAIFSFLLGSFFLIFAVSLNFSDCTGMKIEGCYYNLYTYSLFLRVLFGAGVIFSVPALLVTLLMGRMKTLK